MEEERRQLEQKAQFASRLASVGEMASGIAHEINNPLTGVIGYAQLLLQEDLPENIRKDLETINDGAQRVANVIQRLLAFARQTKPQRTYVYINEVVATTLDLRGYHLETSNIKVSAQLAPDLPVTIADAGQLQQVFLNLIVNAETEMKLARGSGRLSIKTQQIENNIRISFKDDGPGIAEENLERIFDPFFTTRQVGQGTGLGLSVCYGIVSEHGGRIYAESKPGKGATFIVELPIITEHKQLQFPEPAVQQQQKVTGAKILVVDDEPVVREFISKVLNEEGHQVETVDNAEDALEMVKIKTYRIILLDIKMPGMSGIELYKRFQKIAPSLARRVVFVTGDVMGARTMAFLSKAKSPYITKPFDGKQLNIAINRIFTEGR
jgi:CheY-like chemotaxis protein